MNNAAKQKTTSSYSSPTQRFFLLKLKDVGEERFEVSHRGIDSVLR